jgi:hypothetical protein
MEGFFWLSVQDHKLNLLEKAWLDGTLMAYLSSKPSGVNPAYMKVTEIIYEGNMAGIFYKIFPEPPASA